MNYSISAGIRGYVTNSKGFLDWMIGFIGTSFTISSNYERSKSITVSASLHSLLNYERSSSTWLGYNLRVGHFFGFCCLLVNTLHCSAVEC
jgi:hypothetical protein